jgi:hypothetical protein
MLAVQLSPVLFCTSWLGRMLKIVLWWLTGLDRFVEAAVALLREGRPNPKVGGLEQLKYPVSVLGASAVVLGLNTDWMPAASNRVCTWSMGLDTSVSQG